MPDVCAIITTMDNLPNLKETIAVLRTEPLSEIIIVNNGSRDGTKDWLAEQDGLTIVNRENKGAGPGRNAGLNIAKPFDYALMLDGGIRPLRGGVRRMLDYLDEYPECDVVAVSIEDMVTDEEKVWRRWPSKIEGDHTYRNTCLSHTAYCLCRAKAWDGLRFCEDGPFSEPGWGVDDNKMALDWFRAGIVIHVVICACHQNDEQGNPKPCTGVHVYRRAAGSFQRLFDETGVWPNQYGSVYEQRVVWIQQNDPDMKPMSQKGEPWLTVVVRAHGLRTAKVIKRAHELLRRRRFGKQLGEQWQPYSIIAWMPDQDDAFWEWAEPRMLRQHHGDTVVLDGKVVKRNQSNENIWTGDFRLATGPDWRKALRDGAFFYGLVDTVEDAESMIGYYDELYPPPVKIMEPMERRELFQSEWRNSSIGGLSWS